jgi:hypothetical protein
MKVIALLTDFSAVDSILNHLKAELCRSEAAPASDRLSGIIDGRRGRQ